MNSYKIRRAFLWGLTFLILFSGCTPRTAPSKVPEKGPAEESPSPEPVESALQTEDFQPFLDNFFATFPEPFSDVGQLDPQILCSFSVKQLVLDEPGKYSLDPDSRVYPIPAGDFTDYLNLRFGITQLEIPDGNPYFSEEKNCYLCPEAWDYDAGIYVHIDGLQKEEGGDAVCLANFYNPEQPGSPVYKKLEYRFRLAAAPDGKQILQPLSAAEVPL